MRLAYARCQLDVVLAHFNAAPTDPRPVLVLDSTTKARHLEVLRWGLIPYWARDAKIGCSTINAMAESVVAKAAF